MILLKNANIVNDKNEFNKVSILINKDKIEKVSKLEKIENYLKEKNIEVSEVEIIDCTDKLVTESFIDSHIHLREPGFEQKETIKTGTLSALYGGYTKVFAMPNTKPVPDSVEVINKLNEKAKNDGIIDVEFFSAITMGEKGEELVDFEAIKNNKIIGFSDDGKGVQSIGDMYEAMEKISKLDSIISAHCEDEGILYKGYITEGKYSKEHNHRGIMNAVEDVQIGRDILLAAQTGCRYHICHMSTRYGCDLLKLGKTWGAKVTGEVAPHHLILNEDDLKEDGNFKMNPPLRTKKDNEALIKALNEGTIECIATDHAPHTEEEKMRGLESSPFGIVGLETSFPLLYTHLVLTNKVKLKTILNAMGKNIAKVFKLEEKAIEEGLKADLTIIDLNKEFVIDKNTFKSKGKNTPFDGYKVFGKVETVIHNGVVKLKEGNLIG